MMLFLLLHQCSCNPVDEMTAMSVSSVVLEGVVDSIVEDSSMVRYLINVSFVIKGETGDTVSIFSRKGPCALNLERGGEYRIFARVHNDSLFSDVCSGTYRIYSEEEYEE